MRPAMTRCPDCCGPTMARDRATPARAHRRDQQSTAGERGAALFVFAYCCSTRELERAKRQWFCELLGPRFKHRS
jgi:hypothetical protein